MKPDTTPIAMDHNSFAASQPAVIPTKPAKMPLDRLATLSTWSTHILSRNAVNPPAAAESVVFMHTTWIATWLAPVAPNAEPPLNPYHPNHKINVPRHTKPVLCGMNSSLGVIGSNLPIRGPKNCAPT